MLPKVVKCNSQSSKISPLELNVLKFMQHITKNLIMQHKGEGEKL